MGKMKEIVKKNRKRIVAFSLVLIVLVCSVTFLAKAFTNPETYRRTIQSIDDKKVTVLGVSGAIAGTATLLAAVPDDATTPIANKLMELSSYLIIVVCVLVLEKSLLTVFGAVSCYVLIPVACVLAMIFILSRKKVFVTWAVKFAVLALAFLVIVPASMRLSDYIYEVNDLTIAEEVGVVEESTDDGSETEEKIPWYKKLWDTVSNAVKDTVDAAVERGKKVLNEFTDQVTVFVIAYCAIPVFEVFLFLWLFKILFGLKLDLDLSSLKSRKKRENEEMVEVS